MTLFSFILVSVFNFPTKPHVDCLIFLYSPLCFHLSINLIFSQTCISHHRCEKYSNLWCSNKWQMDLQVKRLKEEISTTPWKNFVTGPYHHPQGRDKLLISSVKGEAYGNLFRNILVSVNFLKTLTEECTFCYEALLSKKPADWSY